MAAGLVAATVVAVGLVTVLLTRTGAGTADPSAGPDERVPFSYADDGTLHVGGVELEMEDPTIVQGGEVTLVGRDTRTRSVWSVVGVDGSLTELPGSPAAPPVIASDGSRVAWTEQTGDRTYRVVAYDVASAEVVGTLDAEVDGDCCADGPFLQGVDAEGRIFVFTQFMSDDPLLWDPDGDGAVAVEGVGDGLDAGPGWPGGMEVTPRTSLDGSKRYGTVDDRGVFTEVGQVGRGSNGTPGLWSPSGTRYVYPTVRHGIVVGPVDGGPSRAPRLDLEGANWRPFAWVSDEVVLLDEFREDSRAVVRCDVTTLACAPVRVDLSELAVLPGDGSF